VLILASALGIGILLGFVLQRGGFCGSSLLSSVVLEKDAKGLVGILAAIFVSMAGFAFFARMEWIVPNPNPMRLLSAVVGGVVFGVGMVLAGGCVTGTLFKAGEGRLTSILALVGIGIGATTVDSGALKPLKLSLVVISREIRLFVGVHDAIDLPYTVVGGVIAAVGLVALLVLYIFKRHSRKPKKSITLKALLEGGWSPVTAGIGVGILGWLAYLSSSAGGRNYPLGGHGGVKGTFSLLVNGEYSGSIWTILLVVGILVGSAISARMRGKLKMRSADPATLLFALLGGLLLGVGATIGRGCFIGNSISGMALLSLHSIIFTACIVVANWVTTFLYLRGLR
jgi:uncharacterized membrane protein YedE/YeeE